MCFPQSCAKWGAGAEGGAITVAMADGSPVLKRFKNLFRNVFLDVGIAEEHAVEPLEPAWQRRVLKSVFVRILPFIPCLLLGIT